MLARAYDCLLLDLDGVLFRGSDPVPGAPRTLAELRRLGIRPVFLTNNSSRTPEQVVAKLASVGIAARTSEVVTSALATAELLAGRGGGSAFVIGEDGLREALTAAGIEVLDGAAERADLVVVGFDAGATYASLATASLLVRRGARLVASNDDASFPAEEGLRPGAGALLAAITTATGARAEVVGKPFAPLFETALRRGGGGRALVVGDRLDTDVAGAARLGWDSLLVLSGVTSAEELEASTVRPTYVGTDVGALLDDVPRAMPRTVSWFRRTRAPKETIMVVEEVRKAVGAATDRFSTSGAQELARSLMQGQGKEQISKAAQEISKWSNRNRERLMELVRAEVRTQLKKAGVASRDEVDALRKRVRDLEQRAKPKASAARASAASTTATRRKPATSGPGEPA